MVVHTDNMDIIEVIPRENDEIAVLDHNKKEWWTAFQIAMLAAPSEGEVAALTFLDLSF